MWRRRYILIIACVIASVIVAGILILEVMEKKPVPYASPGPPLESRLQKLADADSANTARDILRGGTLQADARHAQEQAEAALSAARQALELAPMREAAPEAVRLALQAQEQAEAALRAARHAQEQARMPSEDEDPEARQSRPPRSRASRSRPQRHPAVLESRPRSRPSEPPSPSKPPPKNRPRKH